MTEVPWRRPGTDLRMLPVVLVTWTAALLAALVLPAGLVAVCAGALCGGALLLALGRRGRVRAIAALTAVAFAGAALVGVSLWSAAAPRAAAAQVLTASEREVTVRVVGKIERSQLGWRFDAELTDASRAGAADAPAGTPVRVIASTVPDGSEVDAVLAVTARAAPARPGERAVAVLIAGQAELVEPPRPIFRVAAALRHGLVAQAASLPAPANGLVAGLAVGDTSAVTAELDAQMKTASLSHLTAVSGANCALVVGIVFLLAARIGAPRWLRAVLALVALAAFVVLVTPEPSVVRAATMAAIAMGALLLGRSGAGVPVLCAAVCGALVVDPWLATSLGFALSAVATGALLLGARPLAAGLRRWMPAPLALLVAVPLSAQLACGPLLVLITPSVPVYGVLANMLTAPAAPVATVVGLVACLTAGVPALGAGVSAIAWLPAAWIAETARLVAVLPGGALLWWGGIAGALGLALVSAALVGLVVGTLPRTSLGVLVVAAALVLATGPIAALTDRGSVPAQWRIAACQVGQGDAVLIRGGDAVMLVDTGPEPAALERCLQRFGVGWIDVLVLTHFDLDHRGGVPAVAGRVDRVLHGPVPDDAAAATLAALVEGGAAAVPVTAGATGTLGSARWRTLWPDADAVGGNDASVVVEVSGGSVPSILLLGDLSAAPQQRLGARVARVSVVKVAHHGSADQHAGLYERLGAPLALFTVGENTYGHPRREILDLLADRGSTVMRTDTDGDIAVWIDTDGALRVWHAQPQVEVVPTG